jgi:hypothetical protein
VTVRLTDLTYDAWLEHSFGREVRIGRNPWFFDEDHDWWAPTSATYVAYLTRLFEHPEEIMDSFADSQIAQGLTYLVDVSAVGDDGHLADQNVPVADRARMISATVMLFRRLFGARCTPHLSHRDEAGAGILNGRCYMWWDSFPSIGLDGDPNLGQLQQTALAAMADILALDSIACRESALHGLGHWQLQRHGDVEPIIDAFLAANPAIRPELAAYARAARSGCIL